MQNYRKVDDDSRTVTFYFFSYDTNNYHLCPENFRDSLTTPTATIPNIFMGFCSDRPSECSYKI